MTPERSMRLPWPDPENPLYTVREYWYGIQQKLTKK